jgi:hypothetical protein
MIRKDKRSDERTNVNDQTDAGVISIRDNPDEPTARVNLRWQGHYKIADFDLGKLGRVLNSEDETEHAGWVMVERPVEAKIGQSIPLLK